MNDGKMTNSEAIADLEKILRLKFSGTSRPASMRMAIDALGRQEKYRWHDLRKNPEDLPEKNGLYLTYSRYVTQPTPDPDVIVEDEGYTLTDFWDGKFDPQWSGCYETVAWREIEPLEEDEPWRSE